MSESKVTLKLNFSGTLMKTMKTVMMLTMRVRMKERVFFGNLNRERILKVLCPYLQELLRYREYRGRGGKYFDDDDEDDDDGDDDDDFDPRNGDHESQRGLFYI